MSLRINNKIVRKKFLRGNWKRNNTIAEGLAFCDSVKENGLAKEAKNKGVRIGIAPSFVALRSIRKHAHGIIVSAQDCHYADHGAYTSSVSIPMLKEIGVDYSIIGHSEKRAYEGETSFDCNRKIRALVANGFHAIYCVGETAKQYDEGITKDVIREQIVTGLRNLRGTMSSLPMNRSGASEQARMPLLPLPKTSAAISVICSMFFLARSLRRKS